MPHPLLRRAKAEGTPLIDGQAATFVWRGKEPPVLVGDFNDWGRGAPLSLKQRAPGLWARRLNLPRDAYIEYGFVRPARGRGGKGRPAGDPLNPRRVSNGVGGFNHFFFMPEAAPTALARRGRSQPRGQIGRHIVRDPWLVVGGRRAVHLYQPPASAACPLLVVYDGPDYLRRGKLVHVLESLMARGRIQPLALALLANGRQARYVEYAASEATLTFVLDQVLPLAQQELNLVDIQAHPGAFGVLGASMGGLMALYTGLRAPEVFGRVLSQSGAFSIGGRDQVVFDLVAHSPPQPIGIWMDVGVYDIESLLPANRRMAALLRRKGYALTYREVNAGHNYAAWRDDIWRGLQSLFGNQAAGNAQLGHEETLRSPR